jgi:hypothetical protein
VIINAVYKIFPGYSKKFSVKRYEEIIQSTAIIVQLKFREWYKTGTDYSITVAEHQRPKLTSKENNYFNWVTDCLQQIVKRRRLLEDESGDCEEMNFIFERCPEMNKLLNTLLPKGDAQKFNFDQGRVKKIISEFQAIQTSIGDHLVVKTISGGEERM